MLHAILLASALASAQPVLQPPEGASALTVFLCTRSDGCPDEARALALHARAAGTPVLDFDALVAAGPQGGEARRRYREALDSLRKRPSLETALAARDALHGLPETVRGEEAFEILLQTGISAFEADTGLADAGLAEEALAAAAASSGGRLYDLPRMSEATLVRYMELVEEVTAGPPGALNIQPPEDHSVFLDGAPLPPPFEVDVPPGWHRVSVERRGAHAAWVGQVIVPAGETVALKVEGPPDDGVASLEAAVLGVMEGHQAAPEVAGALLDWAGGHRLEWVRFVSLAPWQETAGPVELVPGPDPQSPPWALRATWLDVESGRFTSSGPRPEVLRHVPRHDRFRLGAGLGYARLGSRSHVQVDVGALFHMAGPLSLEARAGVMRAGDPYYLYTGWVGPHIFPLSAGLRLGGAGGGPHGSISGLLVVPYAVGAVARGGWEAAPSTWWRLGLQAEAGFTDRGWLTGFTFRVARRN